MRKAGNGRKGKEMGRICEGSRRKEKEEEEGRRQVRDGLTGRMVKHEGKGRKGKGRACRKERNTRGG